MLTKNQKDALNNARAEAGKIRKAIESLKPENLENGEQWSLGCEVTNMIYALAKQMKAGV